MVGNMELIIDIYRQTLNPYYGVKTHNTSLGVDPYPRAYGREVSALILYALVRLYLWRLIMRCVLNREEEECLSEECRYFTNSFCLLTNIPEEGWPDPGCRFKNKYVRSVNGKDVEMKPMGESGPGNIQ